MRGSESDRIASIFRVSKFSTNKSFCSFSAGVRNESVPKMAIVITDGRSQRDPSEEAKRLTDRNVIVFAVGVVMPERLDTKELDSIAANRPNRVFTGSNLLEFEYEFKNYVSMGCPGANVNLAGKKFFDRSYI